LLVLSNAHGGKAPLFVVRPSAQGDISLTEGSTSNDSVVWSAPNGGSYISTPVVYGGYIYLPITTACCAALISRRARKCMRNGWDGCFLLSLAGRGRRQSLLRDRTGRRPRHQGGPKLEVLAKERSGRALFGVTCDFTGRAVLPHVSKFDCGWIKVAIT
jgi:hypothetical protein